MEKLDFIGLDEDDHCGDMCTGRYDEDGNWDEPDGECVHCECCCDCLGCVYAPQDGMLMFPDRAADAPAVAE